MKYFQGTFDGQGHVISNLKISSKLRYTGLFGYSQGTTIRNVIIDSSCSVESATSKSDPNVGGIIGWCYSDKRRCTVESCVNTGVVSFTGSSKSSLGLGGIAGAISNSNYEITIKNSANYGTVRENTRIGGVVGVCGWDKLKSIENCLNYGSIVNTCASTDFLQIGGIAGYSMATTLINCMSAGKINPTENDIEIGGIAGYIASSSSPTIIAGCFWTNEAWRGNSYGSGNMSSLSVVDSFNVASPKDALSDLNSQASGNSEWNNWFILHLNRGVIGKLEQEEGLVAVEPFPDPVKTGNTFDSWCTDIDCNEKYEYGTTNSSEVTDLYAHYAINSYTVTFKSDDEEEGDVIKSERLDYGSDITYPEEPTRTGHTFNGWDNDITTVPDHDVAIHAKWTVNNYILTFNFDNGNDPRSENPRF